MASSPSRAPTALNYEICENKNAGKAQAAKNRGGLWRVKRFILKLSRSAPYLVMLSGMLAANFGLALLVLQSGENLQALVIAVLGFFLFALGLGLVGIRMHQKRESAAVASQLRELDAKFGALSVGRTEVIASRIAEDVVEMRQVLKEQIDREARNSRENAKMIYAQRKQEHDTLRRVVRADIKALKAELHATARTLKYLRDKALPSLRDSISEDVSQVQQALRAQEETLTEILRINRNIDEDRSASLSLSRETEIDKVLEDIVDVNFMDSGRQGEV